MGFSVSGAAVVIFIGLLASGTILGVALKDVNEARTAGMESKHDRMLEQQNTDVRVTEAVYDSNTSDLRVRVENTGTVTLEASLTDLVVDGDYVVSREAAVDNDTDRNLWTPGKELLLETDRATEPQRIKIVTETGVSVIITDLTGGGS
jgi:archaellum component FlaF (FlaF/FlaG flagellin family)